MSLAVSWDRSDWCLSRRRYTSFRCSFLLFVASVCMCLLFRTSPRFVAFPHKITTGSCGTDYLNDFFVLDTDPPPPMRITEPPSPQLYASRLRHFYNDEEFSDVTFLVEGRKVYGHKLVLSTVSDCFRAMFMTGFRESGSEKAEIEIPNCSHGSFMTMMEYIYTGKGPRDIDVFREDGMDRALALLELSDQFFLYNLKQIVEGVLQPAVNGDTCAFLRQVAQKTNANQLEVYCQYFERNMNELLG